MYRRGIVAEVDPATHRVRVTLPDRDGVLSGWLEVLVRSAVGDSDEGMPDLGNQVAVLLDEHDGAGCVLGAVYSQVDPPKAKRIDVRRVEFADGAVLEYDRAAHVLTVSVPAGGSLKLAGDASFVALAAKVEAELAAIKVALDSHVHPAVGLISAAPGLPVTGATSPAGSAGYAPGSVASAQVKSA